MKKTLPKRSVYKKYTHYYDCRVYAIYYNKSNTIYYNLNFLGKNQLIICK